MIFLVRSTIKLVTSPLHIGDLGLIKMVTKLQRSRPKWRPPQDFLQDVQCCPGPTVERAPESEIVFRTHWYCSVMNSNFGYRTGPSTKGNWVQIMTNLVPQALIS